MKSPFPGMDPYLEQFWREVHHGLITYCRDQLRKILPKELRARIEERFFVEPEDADPHSIYPDVFVVEYPHEIQGEQMPSESAVSIFEPIIIERVVEPASQGYLEIVDVTSGNRVVTVIEFVSPSNKVPGEGRTQYLQKQKEVLDAHANLVEIDLNRTGKRVLAISDSRLSKRRRAHYMACVTRGSNASVSEVYPLYLSQPVPCIRIPLRKTDSDVILNLQALLDQCYENGDYDIIDYRKPPKPPLDPDGAAWTDNWLRAKGVLT